VIAAVEPGTLQKLHSTSTGTIEPSKFVLKINSFSTPLTPSPIRAIVQSLPKSFLPTKRRPENLINFADGKSIHTFSVNLMAKAFSSALSLLLVILILKVAAPDIGNLIAEIIIKILNLMNSGLDLASQNTL
jgi:hypothetical protein